MSKAIACILGFALPCLAADMDDQAKPLSKEELSTFLNSVVPSHLGWTKYIGPDFFVYYGHAKPPATGVVGIYLGGWPWFKADPSLPTVDGRLGIYQVKWQKKVAADRSIRQETLISLHSDYWKAHVWAEATNQSDLDKLVEELSVLPTFQTMPRPVGVP